MGGAGKTFDTFIHFWSIKSLRKKNKSNLLDFLGMSQEPAKPPPPLVSEAPLHHTKLQQKLLCQTLVQKQVFANEAGTGALLLGTAPTYRAKKARRKGYSWPCLGWPVALLRAGSLQPASLLGSAGEASRTTLAHLLQLRSPFGAASLVYSFSIFRKTPGARQWGLLPTGLGEGKAEHPSAMQVGLCRSQAAKPAASRDPSWSRGSRNMRGRAGHKTP